MKQSSFTHIGDHCIDQKVFVQSIWRIEMKGNFSVILILPGRIELKVNQIFRLLPAFECFQQVVYYDGSLSAGRYGSCHCYSNFEGRLIFHSLLILILIHENEQRIPCSTKILVILLFFFFFQPDIQEFERHMKTDALSE
ncbi:MAG: hypothetical protein NTZ69_02405 [Bacteroidia bacterium]|nr:hypothetical protein [Bacteroidia bacterium]